MEQLHGGLAGLFEPNCAMADHIDLVDDLGPCGFPPKTLSNGSI
jgi:hypothetical protein